MRFVSPPLAPRRIRKALLLSGSAAVIALAMTMQAQAQATVTLQGGTHSAPADFATNDNLIFATGFTSTVNAGALSLLGNMTLNGNGVFDFVHGAAIDGAFLGAGDVTFNGATGTSNLSLLGGAGSTHSGRFIINSGIVNANSLDTVNGAIGNSAAVIINGGMLRILRDERVGSLAGVGSVDIATGEILQVGENNTNTSFAGDFQGLGTFYKTGTGRLVLSGDSSGYVGLARVANGVLELNGTLGGDVNASFGPPGERGLLAGTGTINGHLSFGADIAPGQNGGAGIGTLTVNQLTLFAGSGYFVSINAAGQSDLLNVTGGTATNLGNAKVAVAPSAGQYTANTQYTILRTTAGSTFGATRFDPTVVTPTAFAFLAPILSYNAASTEVYLTLTGSGAGGAVQGFSQVAVTPNQINTAVATEALGAANPVFNAIAVQTADGARQAFNALSGEANVSSTSVASADVALVQNTVIDRLRAGPYGAPQAQGVLSSTVQAYSADAPARKGAAVVAPVAPVPAYSLWGQAFGGRGSFDGDWNTASLTRNTGGLIVGVDTGFDGRWRAGFAGAWTRSSFDVASRLSSGDVDTYSGTLYGSGQFGAVALRGGLTYAHHAVDTSRTILFPGYAGAVGTSFDGHSVQAFSEVGYGLTFASFAIEPFAGLAHVSTDLGGFVEAGDAAALIGHGSHTDVTYSSLGVRVAVPFGALTAKGGLSWRHAFGDVTPAGTLAFASNPAVPFTIAGTPIARDTLALEAGLDWALSRNVALGLSYDGQFASRAREHGVKADLRISF